MEIRSTGWNSLWWHWKDVPFSGDYHLSTRRHSFTSYHIKGVLHRKEGWRNKAKSRRLSSGKTVTDGVVNQLRRGFDILSLMKRHFKRITCAAPSTKNSLNTDHYGRKNGRTTLSHQKNSKLSLYVWVQQKIIYPRICTTAQRQKDLSEI